MGRALDLEPQNISLLSLEQRLDAGFPVYVMLEPGDGTRYQWIITPLWAHAYVSGAGISRVPWEWLMVTRADQESDACHKGVMIRSHFWSGDFYPICRANEYTMKLMARFFMDLWKQHDRNYTHEEYAQIEELYG